MIKKLLVTALIAGFTMVAQAKQFIVDVRTAPEIAQTGKVQGALVDDIQSPDFLQKFNSFGINPKEDEVLLYCRSGKRAGMAKEILEKAGYKDVKNLGGFEQAAETLHKPLVK